MAVKHFDKKFERRRELKKRIYVRYAEWICVCSASR